MNKILLPLLLALCLLTTGCHQEGAGPAPDAQPSADTVEYTNLTGQSSRDQLVRVMTMAGVSAQRQTAFFQRVAAFQDTVGTDGLHDGFSPGSSLTPPYDPYAMQDAWTARFPDLPGWNCRITAFSLFGDLVEVPADGTQEADSLFMDLITLELDPTVFPVPEDVQRFTTLYAAVPTPDTKDVSVHVSSMQQAWQDRGIHFQDRDGVRLISVVFHDLLDDSRLFIGHTGLLFPTEEGLLFLEKLAFQEPYQLSRFPDRQALNDYLMGRYDTDQGQPMAAPFILENDQLMASYRRLPEAEQK